MYDPVLAEKGKEDVLLILYHFCRSKQERLEMSKYELIYYNSRGYAEPIRILFSLAGKCSGH